MVKTMWRHWRQLLRTGAAASVTERSGGRAPDDADPLRCGRASPGSARIVTMVSRQFAQANMSQPWQWHTHRGFVLGYVDALADLNASNGGEPPAGRHSRALSASVLCTLCGDAHADALITELADTDVRTSRDFRLGRDAAFDDYDQWSEREMSGLATFIDAAQAELLRLVPQPVIESAPVRARGNTPLK